MDHHRWRNLTRARRAFEDRLETAGDGPLEAFLEVSARCNLRCVMCAINVDRRYDPGSGRPGTLEPELFDALRPSFPNLIRAYLFGLGEPLLNPHLCAYARALSQDGAEVWFNTNGTLIDDRVADRLARAGVTAVTVSMDGATAATYERIRRGASFHAVVQALRALTEARRRHGRPAVDLSFVAMSSNLSELPDLVDLCANEGVDAVHVEPLFAQNGDELGELYDEQNLGRLGSDQVTELFIEAERRARRLGVGLTSRYLAEASHPDYLRQAGMRPPWWRCSEPWTSIWVTAAGEVRCCCLNDTSFGSLSRESLRTIWNGDSFREFRRIHANGELPASCANCRRNGRIRLSPYFEAVEPVTYRPLNVSPSAAAAGRGPVFSSPGSGEVVADPLVLTGRLGDLSQRAARELEVVIDRTAVANVGCDGVVDGHDFVLSIPVPYLSEGAHLLWLRPLQSPQHPGWAHRTIHFWRPEAAETSCADGVFAMSVAVPRLGTRPRVFVDGAPVAYRWLRAGRIRGRHGAAILDTSAITPGYHVLRIEVRNRPSVELRLFRLPTNDP